MDVLREAVCGAKTRLAAAGEGGHAVVYAIRVDSTCFEASRWQQHLADWQLGIREVNLPCSVQHIPAARLIAKAVYPNGTESDFVLSCATWDEVMAIRGGARR
jgi:hypothetical protein